ncbi:MAG: hypothetical protein GF398_02410 [Chitinivibrionales bacterium]|nr:hypothetical protein [Chitinivibrionales bacterium]
MRHTFCMASIVLLMYASAHAELVADFSDQGIESLKYAGVELISPLTNPGNFAIPHAAVTLEKMDLSGTYRSYDFTSTSAEAPSISSYKAASKTCIRAYSWGTARVAYDVKSDRLDITAVLKNSTQQTVANFNIILLHFVHRDGWKDVGVASTLDRFGYNGFTDATLKALVASPSFDTPLKLQLKPCGGSCGRPLIVTGGITAPDTSQRTIHPHGMPRIAAGDSLTLKISIRFDNPATSELDMLDDLIDPYRQSLSPLHVWPDRRPIGMIFHSSGYSGHVSATNPRGYFNDPKTDIISDSGKQAFYKRMLEAADREIANLQKMGSQGMILWDIEGSEHAAITYVGDPRMTVHLAPEMDEIADQYFKKYTDAGLRAGVCLRPTRVYWHSGKDKWQHNTGSDGGHEDGITQHAVYQHLKAGDLPWWDFFPTVERMTDKIQYCIDRWGCSLFYIDTPGEWRRVGVNQEFTYVQLQTYLYRELAHRFPDVFIIPEFTHESDMAYVGDYMELDLGGKGTGATRRRLFPDAISVINVSNGNFSAHRDRLYRAIEEGDIIMHHGWWWSARNQEVLELYQQAIGNGVELIRGSLPSFKKNWPDSPAQKDFPAHFSFVPGTLVNSTGMPGQFSIFDLTGRCVYARYVKPGVIRVPVPSSLHDAMYLVRFTGSERTCAGRMMLVDK